MVPNSAERTSRRGRMQDPHAPRDLRRRPTRTCAEERPGTIDQGLDMRTEQPRVDLLEQLAEGEKGADLGLVQPKAGEGVARRGRGGLRETIAARAEQLLRLERCSNRPQPHRRCERPLAHRGEDRFARDGKALREQPHPRLAVRERAVAVPRIDPRRHRADNAAPGSRTPPPSTQPPPACTPRASPAPPAGPARRTADRTARCARRRGRSGR